MPADRQKLLFEPRLNVLIVVLILASSCIWVLLFPFTLDDAYITFHYARNLARGLPLGTWNPGEPPVEGFSSMLWTLIMGLGMWLHLSPFYLSKTLGYLSAIGMPIACYVVYRDSRNARPMPLIEPQALACAAILLASSVPIFYYAATGMEADLFSFLVLLILIAPNVAGQRRRIITIAIVSAALVFTRPEGVLVACVVNAFWFVNKRDPITRTWSATGLIATGAACIALITFRVYYFHAFVPNTYFAKGTGGSSIHRVWLGLRYLAKSVQLLAPTVLVLGFLCWRYSQQILKTRFVHLLWILGTVYTLYILKVGGDPDSAFPLRRHFVHIAAVIALFLGAALAQSIASQRQLYRVTLAIAAASALWATVGWCIPLLHKGVDATMRNGLLRPQPPEPIWAWFAQYSSERTLTAVTGAGQWPYLVPGRYIDMLGLNDRHIATEGTVDTQSRYQDSKSDMNYVLSRNPDIIDGYMDADSLVENRCPEIEHTDRVQMLRTLRANPTFQRNYVFVMNGPYSLWARAVFIRSSYLKEIQQQGLITVPVSETSLYKEGCN